MSRVERFAIKRPTQRLWRSGYSTDEVRDQLQRGSFLAATCLGLVAVRWQGYRLRWPGRV